MALEKFNEEDYTTVEVRGQEACKHVKLEEGTLPLLKMEIRLSGEGVASTLGSSAAYEILCSMFPEERVNELENEITVHLKEIAKLVTMFVAQEKEGE